MLEDDATLVDENDVVQELDKNTTVVVMNEHDEWESAAAKKHLDNQTTEKTDNMLPNNNMRLTINAGNLQLRKPTKEVTTYNKCIISQYCINC